MPELIRHVDDFYPDPDAVRQHALDAEYHVPRGVYGYRTRKGYLPEGTVERMRSTFGFTEVRLQSLRHRTTHFYTSLAKGRQRVTFFAHYDAVHKPARPSYAMVVYLTPRAPKSSGTGVFRHRQTGIWMGPTGVSARQLGMTRPELETILDRDSQRRERWQLLHRVDNIYNRAVVFPAHWYHSSTREFGNRPDNGKLYQAFFFEAWPDVFADVSVPD